jgi:hypothetical protein
VTTPQPQRTARPLRIGAVLCVVSALLSFSAALIAGQLFPWVPIGCLWAAISAALVSRAGKGSKQA